MAGKQQLKPAEIEVKIDTRAAEAALNDLKNRRQKGEGDSDDKKRKDDKRKDDKKSNEKRNIAVIPGTGVLRRIVGVFVQVKIAQFVAELGAAGATELGETLKAIPGMQATLDKTSGVLSQLSEKVELLGGIAGAGFGAAADAGAFARSQKLLTGSSNLADVRAIGKQQLSLRALDAQIEARKTVSGRVASKGVVVEIGANTAAKMLEQFGVVR